MEFVPLDPARYNHGASKKSHKRKLFKSKLVVCKKVMVMDLGQCFAGFFSLNNLSFDHNKAENYFANTACHKLENKFTSYHFYLANHILEKISSVSICL